MRTNKTPEDIGTTLALLWPEAAPAPGEEGDAILDAERMIVAERRAKTARLYYGRKTMREIAAELKIGLATVHDDIHTVLEGWARYARQNLAMLVVNELARLNELERDITVEWEKSKGEVVETSTGRRTGGSGGGQDTAAVKKKQRYGDPRLAALLLKCWESRCKLLKLLTPDDMKGNDNLPPVKFVAGLDPVEAV